MEPGLSSQILFARLHDVPGGMVQPFCDCKKGFVHLIARYISH